MDSVTLAPEIAYSVRPLPGRVILRILPKPAMEGSIHIPDAARGKTISDTLQLALVVAVGYDGVSHKPEDLAAGDRVLFRPLQMELNQEYVVTDARRVDAVVE